MVALLKIPPPTKDDALLAWATYRALLLARVADPSLDDDLNHFRAVEEARQRFERVYDEWAKQ